MSGRRQDYIHGTTPDEQRRLSRLNDLINRESLSRLRIAPGERVLDMGCGLGQLSRAMVQAGASGVVGIERSSDQIAAGTRHGGMLNGLDIREGDVLDPPLSGSEWGTFDVVHARFILEHLADPLAALKVMVRAARPGGRIVLEDDDHELLRLSPPVAEFERLWQAYMRSYEALGCDPCIGRRLPQLLSLAGAGPVRCDWPFFGACHGSGDWDTIVANCRAILTGARCAIEAEGISPEDFDGGLRAYDAWREQPGAAFWYCTFWAEGMKPLHA